ncbi:MAG: hypothetical protein ACYTGP_12405, partial [Planctomycetota bacterium]
MAAHQKRSDRALRDLAELQEGALQEGPMEVLMVISDGELIDYFRRERERLALEATMVVDGDDVLWGRLGVVVTPTVLLVDE